MKPAPSIISARRPTLVSAGVVLFAALLLHPLLGCMDPSGGCMVDEVAPVNIVATAGNGAATITWDIAPYDTLAINNVWAQVQYAEAGGTGEQCNSYHPNDLAQGCAVACPLSGSRQCTVTGLTNGVSYTFTVVTQSSSPSLQCGHGTAFARSAPVTPGAP